MSDLQCQILYDQKKIRELEQRIERLNAALRLERCRVQSLRDQLEERPKMRAAMAMNA